MIITISGVPGSGKTSVGKILAKKLGMDFYSAGEFRGQIAQKRGLTIDQLNALGEDDPSTDTEIDEFQKNLGQTQDNFIMEGRLAWYFIPKSFKISLSCAQDESAKRIFLSHHLNERSDEKTYISEQDAKQSLIARTKSDTRRYKKYYKIDAIPEQSFDLIIDTTKNTGPEQTVDQILDALKKQNIMN